jgi:hypothetical protein
VLYWPDADYSLRPKVGWSVNDGRLNLTYTENGVGRQHRAESTMTLWLYRPDSSASSPFEVDLPGPLSDGGSVALDLPESLQALRRDADPVSPEGYRFKVSSRGSRGLFLDLFGGYRTRTEYQLVGHGVRHALPEQGRYMATGAFVAWVIEDERATREK